MITNRDTAEHYRWGDGCDGWRLVAHPDLDVTAERMPPGTRELRHVHARARQVFYVLEGALHIEVAGHDHTLAPGDALEIAPGRPHLVTNPGPAAAAFLVVSSPSTRADRTPA